MAWRGCKSRQAVQGLPESADMLDTLLQRQDARVKLLLALAFILALGLSPMGAWPSYLLFAALLFSLEILSGKGIRYYLIRSLLALGFSLAAVPLVFQPGGRQILAFQALGISWGIYAAGLERFLSIAFKSMLSMQAALLLAATTGFVELLAAMRQLHLPKVLVAIMSLMWRYLFLLREEAQRMLAARASRSVRPPERIHQPPLAWRAHITGGMAGSLLLRSIERSERVYAAMLARGYNGELPGGPARQLQKRDWLLLSGGAAGLVFLWLFGFLFGG